MDSETSVWASLLYSWAPILLMIGFWVFIMRKMGPGRQARYVERSLAFMERQEQLLDRIATALERRNARGE
jgi:ATP-dependent Zn protease